MAVMVVAVMVATSRLRASAKAAATRMMAAMVVALMVATSRLRAVEGRRRRPRRRAV
jgi:hypothetical protein